MIVRNGAATLAACLESVAPLCEEMIIVDTGSNDDSMSIARSFGAKVVETSWADDFSAARNLYLRKASCPWVLSLDADEVLGKVHKDTFIDGLERNPATAFMFRIRNYFFESDLPELTLPSKLISEGSAGISSTISMTIRLFPRLRGLTYSYPVHETLLPAIRRKGLRLKHCAIPIHHRGHLINKEHSQAKAKLYRILGQKKIIDFPHFFLGYLELGKICFHDADLEEAERMFTESIRLRPRCLDAYCFLALTLFRQKRFSESREVLQRALRRFPNNSDAKYVLDFVNHAEENTSKQLPSLKYSAIMPGIQSLRNRPVAGISRSRLSRTPFFAFRKS